jgi:acetyl-CoA carboxylase carboxyl transferase subunit beta
MGLRDFFKAKRIEKFGNKAPAAKLNISDEKIAQNWIACQNCGTRIYKQDFENNLNVCTECGHHHRISSEARIKSLVDPNSFKELFNNISSGDPLKFNDGRKDYPVSLKQAQDKTGLKDAITCGVAKIAGAQVAIAVMNFSFLGGSMGSVVGEKFTRLIKHAIKNKIAVISFASSGGARMHEGIFSLMQMAKTSTALAELSKAALPFISVMTDPTYGGVSASFASLGDYLVAEPGARIGFAGRRVIEETVKEKLPDDFQSAEYLLAHGQLDFISSRHDMRDNVCKILQIHDFEVDCSSKDSKAKLPNLKEVALEFEKPLLAIQNEIKNLEQKISSNEDQQLLNRLKDQYQDVATAIYSQLSSIDITKIARHPNRPNIEDYLNIACNKGDWLELHGDRSGTDDEAILTALVNLKGYKFIAIGMRKGRSIKENQARNFGMPQPEGYRKAKRIMELADKFSLPIVTFIDTPGAYPGLNAEANGQSIAIAENLKTLAELSVPVIAIVTGEGGSGGALAIGVANRVLMLENSIYSVISPEGCAAILWKTRDKAPEAAEALKITSDNLYKLGVVDEVLAEPLGGAHKDWYKVAATLEQALIKHLKELNKLSAKDVKKNRADKFYKLGAFVEKVKV